MPGSRARSPARRPSATPSPSPPNTTSRSGAKTAPLALPGGAALAATCAADRATLDRLRTRSPALRFGAGVTSATITTSDARAELLAARYAAATESMEGFAVLRAAALGGIAAIELRGVSNVVGDRATSQWDFRAGAAAAVRALELFFAQGAC